MKIITQKVLDCDAPTITGRIYPRDMMQAAITEYMSQTFRTGQLGFPEGTLVISMDKVSHTVENLFFDGNALMAEIKLLDTPAGQILQGMVTENAPFRLAACGTGMLDTDLRVSDYRLVQVVATIKEPEQVDYLAAIHEIVGCAV